MRARVIVSVCLLVGLALPVIDASDGAVAKKRRATTVTQTFTSAGTLNIPDVGRADPYPWTLEVTGLAGAKVTDVNVVLRQFSHGTAGDVDLLLVAPNGRSATILSDLGGEAPAVTLRLDDSAAGTFPVFDSLEIGSYVPANYDGSRTDAFPDLDVVPNAEPLLSVFNGGDPNGQWRLYVVDDEPNQDGYIDRWSLEITAKPKKTRHPRAAGHPAPRTG